VQKATLFANLIVFTNNKYAGISSEQEDYRVIGHILP
jgi:hypothetical protein